MLMKLVLATVSVVACGHEPSTRTHAVRDQHVVLGLQRADVGDEEETHELLLCVVSDEYDAHYLAENCVQALSSRTGKRVVFTQQPQIATHTGQRERVMVVATPVVTGALAWLATWRHSLSWDKASRGKMRKWLQPRTVAKSFGVVALGTLAFVLLFDQYTAGGEKRATARYWEDIFSTDTDFKVATEVRKVEKILHVIAQELTLKVTPAAQRMLAQ